MTILVIIGFVTLWVIMVIYFAINTIQYRKATKTWDKSSDFYIRSSVLGKLGDVEGYWELREVAVAYHEEAERLSAIAKKWDFTVHQPTL